MTTYTYVQLLATEQPNNEQELADMQASYRWAQADEAINWRQSTTGSEADLMQWLEMHQTPVVLVIPGEQVVSCQLPYNQKEKKHFVKTLPYQIEEQVMGDVDDLHFAVGRQQEPLTTVAYVDKAWIDNLLQRFSQRDINVVRCIADFQLITAHNNELVVWFRGDSLQGHQDDGVGFSTTQDLAPVILQNVLASCTDNQVVKVYITGDFDGEQFATSMDDSDIKLLFHPLASDIEHQFYSEPPQLSLNTPQQINFYTGAYRKKLPIDDWLKEFRSIGFLAAAAAAIFLIVNISGIYVLESSNDKKRQQIEKAYRSVVPQGVVNDPVRQLKRKLGQASSDNHQASQSVYLLSLVAPAIQSLDIDLSTINYSNKEQSMRINIQAQSFNVVEQFRTQLSEKGLTAKLLSSNAVEDKFQARLNIGLEAR